jgi:hypothetical protein
MYLIVVIASHAAGVMRNDLEVRDCRVVTLLALLLAMTERLEFKV